MSNNFVIRKNTIEIKRERLIIHRKQVSCITYIDPIEGEVPSYGVGLWFNPPIEIESTSGENTYKYKFIYVYCEDYLPFVEWFDNDEQKFFETTLEKHKHTGHRLEPVFPDPAPLGETLVDLLYAKRTPDSETIHLKPIIWDTCTCCNEQMLSVCERPEFNNELLCNTCYKAKIALAKLDYEKTKEEKLLKGYVELNEDLTIKYELEGN